VKKSLRTAVSGTLETLHIPHEEEWVVQQSGLFWRISYGSGNIPPKTESDDYLDSASNKYKLGQNQAKWFSSMELFFKKLVICEIKLHK
jgi:hypothetical protein